jgi:lysozyme
MKAGDAILHIQEVLGLPANQRFPRIGPATRAAFDRLAAVPPETPWGISTVSAAIAEADATREISPNGIALVKHFEGLWLEAGRDEVGIWTIGWGHTGLQHNDGTVHAGRKISEAKAEELLRYDMHQFEARVLRLITVPLSQDEFDALVSFDFNCGGLTLDDQPGNPPSTLTRKLNAGDRAAAADQFLAWNKAGGRVLKGLTRRRQSERNLFLGNRPFLINEF